MPWASRILACDFKEEIKERNSRGVPEKLQSFQKLQKLQEFQKLQRSSVAVGGEQQTFIIHQQCLHYIEWSRDLVLILLFIGCLPTLIAHTNQNNQLIDRALLCLLFYRQSQTIDAKCVVLSLCTILKMTSGQSKHCLGIVYHG